MAIKEMITHKIIQAKEGGKPKIRGVAEEKKVYPGHITANPAATITTTNIILAVLIFESGGREYICGLPSLSVCMEFRIHRIYKNRV